MPPTSTAEFRRALDRVLDGQRGQARGYERDGYGPVYRDVTHAVGTAAQVVDGLPPAEDPVADWEAVLGALTEAHGRWRMDETDEGGYGSATFHEIRREVSALRPPGPPTEKERALAQSYQRASAGDPEAMMAMCEHYRTQQLRPDAAAWLERAAVAGHRTAVIELANNLVFGATKTVATASRSEARRWAERAAALGEPGPLEWLERS